MIPARSGSKGIPNKNWKLIADGPSPAARAIGCALNAGLRVVVSCDRPVDYHPTVLEDERIQWLHRPAEFAGDTTPMIDVVKHALSEIPGPPEQIICLLQPTQPLREPKHIKAAIALLESSGADSVVSVVELPQTHHPEFVCDIVGDRLFQWDHEGSRAEFGYFGLWNMPVRRQASNPVYIRDGTVYAFRRSTVSDERDIYGMDCRPLIIPASDTQALDTPEDWLEAERRLKEREVRA